jgi:IclR family pca regulon transcriptional regulator
VHTTKCLSCRQIGCGACGEHDRTIHGLAREAHELGIRALAVPLRNMQGQTLAALNVVGTAKQLSDSAVQRKWLPLLLEAARDLRVLL